MSPFAFLLLCIQACLIQNAYSACLGAGLGLGFADGWAGECGRGYGLATEFGYGPGLGLGYETGLGLGYGLAGPAAIAGPAYGGTGVGDIAVAGEMGVAGTTLVAGQVPILGAVRFGGEVPAGGVVSIAGNCAGGCGCNGAYNGGYLY
ncbi:PREDICTED: chorion class A protein L11-like [Papilio xuthus]|uniref:Chorion class A protein L11-like n=1 Tax=Papilio xuthus TaxID=66420 RepID=A0AAJ7EFP3_PAPXU|nr:PREDICTED: chorion class A protein L11-like [Papilio xuthus]XP_013175693.1 PREDICTED: chorion class A protein L11-like [Papilio xuthus]